MFTTRAASSSRRPRPSTHAGRASEKKIIVDAKTKDVEALIADIKEKTESANAQQAQAEIAEKEAVETWRRSRPRRPRPTMR